MSSANAPPAGAQEDKSQQHEQEIEQREAYEFWGYLFKPDKTGTDKLKRLLRGLKELINVHYEPSDNPDLTPNQLAHFYRELHGNYDQLFLGTPSESIAFIYKSLGCLHSLQPLPHSAFTDPTIPALKTEGWIMWQTIQLLLGPEEHSSFLMEAVQKWDVKDPATGESFPKILPRQCFPMESDKHMVAWYEGVSERLRREAEEEERQREIEAQQAETRRLRYGKADDIDDEASVDSRGRALEYFRNPLYRHVDGRPTIVRRNSKRPTISPRPTFVNKGKEAATSVGHVIRNIGSPHLWDGRGGHSKSESRGRDGSRRRRSLPDSNRYSQSGDPAQADSHLTPHDSSRHQRRRSAQYDTPNATPSGDEWNSDNQRSSSRHHHEDDQTLRHSRSHDPTPSQKEVPDYFYGYDHPSRRNSSQNEGSSHLTPNGIGPSFGPSASPLFMAHVAKQPQPPPLTRMQPPPSGPPQPDAYGRHRTSASFGRAQGRPYSQSPDPSQHHRSRDRDDRRNSRRYSSHERRSRYEGSQASYDTAGPTNVLPPTSQPGFPPVGAAPSNMGGIAGSAQQMQGGARDRQRRGSNRTSGSEAGGGYGGPPPEDRERKGSARPKQTRFVAGVEGRRYPNQSPW